MRPIFKTKVLIYHSKANLDEKILFGSIPHLTVLNIGHILFIPQPSKRRNFFFDSSGTSYALFVKVLSTFLTELSIRFFIVLMA